MRDIAAIRKLVLSLLALVLCGGNLLASSQEGSFSGKVLDQSGAAIPRAVIELQQDGSKTLSTLSDENGSFEFVKVQVGHYRVTASGTGFSTSMQEIEIRPGETIEGNLALTVARLSEQIQVNSSSIIGNPDILPHIPGAVDVITASDLASSGVFTLNEAVRKISGLNARDEEGFGLRPNIGIRGLNPTRSSKVLLLEDGLSLGIGRAEAGDAGNRSPDLGVFFTEIHRAGAAHGVTHQENAVVIDVEFLADQFQNSHGVDFAEFGDFDWIGLLSSADGRTEANGHYLGSADGRAGGWTGAAASTEHVCIAEWGGGAIALGYSPARQRGCSHIYGGHKLL